MAKGTRITVDLGSEELLKAIKIAAIERGKSIREITTEAFREWLERREALEDKEDLKAMMEAESEYRKTGGRLFDDIVKDLGKEEFRMSCLSEPSLMKIWDNSEDALYDNL